MTLTNQELKDITFKTLEPIQPIEVIEVEEIWKVDGKHFRELTAREDYSKIIASIHVDDSFTADQVRCLLMAEVDYLEEYFLNQNK